MKVQSGGCDPALLRFGSARRIVITRKAEPHAEEWLLVEWPKGETEPAKYWLSTLSPETKLKDLVKMAKHRWIIERDYQELLSFVKYSDNSEQRSLLPAGGYDCLPALHGLQC